MNDSSYWLKRITKMSILTSHLVIQIHIQSTNFISVSLVEIEYQIEQIDPFPCALGFAFSSSSSSSFTNPFRSSLWISLTFGIEKVKERRVNMCAFSIVHISDRYSFSCSLIVFSLFLSVWLVRSFVYRDHSQRQELRASMNSTR